MPLWVSGNALALWAIIVLGLASTFGGEGALIKRGPYAISRNPQYVGFIAALIGWSVLTNSALTLVAVLVGVIPLILVPFSEEPWLLEMHRSVYEAYRRAVPRFLFFRSRNSLQD